MSIAYALYAEIPEPLRGYVELVYDLNGNPSFRLIEALLYRSPHFKARQDARFWDPDRMLEAKRGTSMLLAFGTLIACWRLTHQGSKLTPPTFAMYDVCPL